MKKISDFIVEKRKWILGIFLVLTIISFYLMGKVNINSDITKYLPKDSETKIGMNIMESEIGDLSTSTLNVMFQNKTPEEVEDIIQELKSIEGVKIVSHDASEDYEKDGYFLFTLTIDGAADSKTASNVYDTVVQKYEDNNIVTGGEVASKNASVLPASIVALAIASAMVILIIMCESYVEPFLFLFAVGLAVFINKGTNVFFGSVSNITDSIVAVLQMALSMDYSIMLMNRYIQEKEREKDNVKAMKTALYKSFSSISSSSVTTIVGLLALVFMSFTIGRDLGIILAKGVLFSLISIFFCLPGLILMFDKWIVKTKKKSFSPKLNKFGSLSYKLRFIAPVLLILIFGFSFVNKGNLTVLFTQSENDEIAQVFPESNQMALVYENNDEEKIINICSNLENNDKVTNVLCFSNTINEKVTYDNLKIKMEELGSSQEIPDYLIKLIYYEYYNKESISLTVGEFINFIKNDVLEKEEFSSYIDASLKDNIDTLEYFVNIDSLQKKRSSAEIASILGLDLLVVDDILTLYNSNTDATLTIKEFLTFVINNNTIKTLIDENTLNNFKMLLNFTDTSLISKGLTSEEMANYFNMDEDLINSVYLYYILNNDIDINLSINEFTDYVLNNVLTNSKYISIFSDEDINNITLLNTFSNPFIISEKMDYKTLSNLFNIDEDTTKNVLYLNYQNDTSNLNLTLPDFIKSVKSISENTTFLDNADISEILKLYDFLVNTNDINNTKLPKAALASIFDSNLVDAVYYNLGLTEDTLISPLEFVNLVLENFTGIIDTSKIEIIKLVMENDATSYNVSQMAGMLDKNVATINSLYDLINYVIYDNNGWYLTPYEFTNFLISNNLSNSDIILINGVMASSLNNIKYSYQDLANFIGTDEKTLKNIYALYISENESVVISPYEFVEFLINKKSDELIASYLDKDTLSTLNLVKNIMHASVSNKKFSYTDAANLLNGDVKDFALIYGLYEKSISSGISLSEFITYLNDSIINNPVYSNNLDSDTSNSIKGLYLIVDATKMNYSFTSNDMYEILKEFNDLDKNIIDIIYTYYGSNNLYSKENDLTILEFVTFMRETILKDSKYSQFLNQELREKINLAYDTVNDAKDLLVGENYSRIVINTTYGLEDPETFDFIKNLKTSLEDLDVKAYLIGDSPMAYELDQSFDKELNVITILTMIFIFIVVALTFKSLIIPIILVLIIQTAVYLVMGILSIFGGSLYFIAILIVQSILMGATIDYAILYTTYYLESRNTKGIKESMIDAYNKSIHTILTSSCILMIVTIIVGKCSTAMAAKICTTISEGTLCSVLLILFLLPPILGAFDKIIVKKNLKR